MAGILGMELDLGYVFVGRAKHNLLSVKDFDEGRWIGAGSEMQIGRGFKVSVQYRSFRRLDNRIDLA